MFHEDSTYTGEHQRAPGRGNSLFAVCLVSTAGTLRGSLLGGVPRGWIDSQDWLLGKCSARASF